MQRNKKRVPKNNSEQNNLVTALTGGAMGLGVTTALMLISPLLLLKSSEPKSLLTATAAMCILTGGIVSGLFCGNRDKNSPIITSIFSCGIMILPLILMSVFIRGSFDILSAVINIVSLFSSAPVTAFILNRSSKSRGKNMKKIMKRR